MGGAKNCPETPRQKMISMMYLVLTAMLALNVSAEILNGYSLVDESMRTNITIGEAKVSSLQGQFDGLLQTDSIKANLVKSKIDSVILMSDQMCDVVSSIQKRMILLIDGAEADTLSKDKMGDLNIPSQVGIQEKRGAELKAKMNEYSAFMASVVDSAKAQSILNTFATPDIKKGGETKSWESGVFLDMPAIASITVLDKIKNDVKNAEADALSALIGGMDANDFRVNKITAMAVAKSGYIMRGAKYSAEIMLAAIDSTKKPTIIINGEELKGPNQMYEFTCNKVGTHKYSGELILQKPDGTPVKYPFEQEYTVGEPTATVSADLMNVLYAGFKNPVSVSVPGVAGNNISINVSNCKSQAKTGTGWTIVPAKVGVPCKISVSANIDGKSQHIKTVDFRVKKLPDPLAKIEYTNAQGVKELYKGGKAIAKNLLITARRIVAELDDADLEVKYKVLGFSLNYFDSMGNTLVEKTDGDKLTDRQMRVFREMTRQKTVFVTNVVALGQDNLKRSLPPVEVKIK